MAWPMSQDYNEAVQNPATCFSDPELRQGQPVCNALGLPAPCSGNFADVYQLRHGGRSWAVKCFTRQIPGLQERYVQISGYLAKVRLPFMVEFKFLEQGIRVRGLWYPILKMDWVEGLTLNAFVRDNLDKPQTLDALCQLWLKLAKRLREGQLAHCDLQHGNVLLVQGGKAGALSLRLVDYDGMCVPALTLLKSIEVGHPNYQHPQRAREGIYSLEVDRFSHLVIYTALRGLMTGGRPLWEKFDNGDNLLFKQADFEAPEKSPLLYELLKGNDGEVRKLTQALVEAIRQPLDRVPLLEKLANGRAAAAVVARKQPPVAARGQTEDVFAVATTTNAPASASVRRRVRRKAAGLSCLLLAGGVGAAVLLMGVIAGGILLSIKGRPENPNKERDVAVERGANSNKKDPVENSKRSEAPRKPPTDVEKGPVSTPLDALDRSQIPAEELAVAGGGDPQRAPMELVAILGNSRLGSAAAAYSIAFSPDGNHLAWGGWKVLTIWHVRQRRELTLEGHSGRVHSLCFSPDGQRLAANSGKAVKIWDAATGQEVLTLEGHAGEVMGVTFSPDGKRLAAAATTTVTLWDPVTGQKGRILTGRDRNQMLGVAFSPDGKQLAAGNAHQPVTVWDTTTGEELLVLKGNTEPLPAFIEIRNHSMAFSPDGKRLAAVRYRNIVKVWEPTEGREILTLEGHSNTVVGVAFSPDGTRLASSSRDTTTKLWDVKTGQALITFKGHAREVNSMAFSPDSRYLATANGNGTVYIYRLDLKPQAKPDPPVVSPVPKDNGIPQMLIASKRNGNFEILLINADGTDIKNLTNHPASDTDPAWSPDGSAIAFASDRDGSQNIYRMNADGSDVRQLTRGTEKSYMPTWSPDGKKIAFSRNWRGGDPRIFVMDADGSNQMNLTPSRPAYDPAWSPDGKKIAFASHSGRGFRLSVMDSDGGNAQILSATDNTFGAVYPAWSPDGKQIAYGEMCGGAVEICVWDTEEKTLKQLTKSGGVNCFPAWSPDGKKIAFARYGRFQIMDADGSNRKEISGAEVARSGWRPK